jgi:hypothetical protein
MAIGDDCPNGGGDDAAAPGACGSSLCGAMQAPTAAYSLSAIVAAPGLAARIADDTMPGGIPAPPDLRPPIS